MISAINITKPSWFQFGLIIEDLISKIESSYPNYFTKIVGLQRGGLVGAVTLSNVLDIPMVTADYSSSTGKGENAGNHENVLPHLTNENLLIVDDIYDSGNTMDEVMTHYRSLNNNCIGAVLYCKMHKNRELPISVIELPSDFKEWIIFPFEVKGFLK